MNIKPHCLAVVALAFASASHLSAQTVTSQFNNTSPSRSVSGTFDGINSRTIKSGVMNFDDFESFCIDPYQGVNYNSPTTFNIEPAFSTLAVRDAIAHLVGGYYASAQTAQDAASIQWAIWEVVVDGTSSPSLYSGNTRVFDQATAELGQKYLENIDNLPEANVQYLTHHRYQDVVTIVPEPSSSLLLGLATCGFLIRRKRG